MTVSIARNAKALIFCSEGFEKFYLPGSDKGDPNRPAPLGMMILMPFLRQYFHGIKGCLCQAHVIHTAHKETTLPFTSPYGSRTSAHLFKEGCT